MEPLDTNRMLAVATVAGFAIQQAIQVLDVPLSGFVEYIKERRTTKDFPGGVSQGDFKKSVATMLALALGLLVKKLSGITLLGYINPGWQDTFGDYLVTALVISAGTEGVNTLLKYVGYVKDARKPEPSSVVVSIIPPTVIVKAGITVQFAATVANADDTSVRWKILQGNGGAITDAGLYTAPSNPGTYHVMATSVADPTKFATAVVTVAP